MLARRPWGVEGPHECCTPAHCTSCANLLRWGCQAGQAHIVGLAGMGGIGKTTLATALFNHLLPAFSEASCFLQVCI